MKKLSKYHKSQISKGLRKSQRHKTSQANKDVVGKRNPNWKPKVIYICPVCSKEILVTEKNFVYLTKIGRTCSRKCGSVIVANKIRGKKRPDVSLRMKESNPMSNPEIAKRQSKSLKKRFASGELDELRKKLSMSGKRNRIKYNMSIKGRKKIAIRMKKNNPMFRKEISRKVSKAMRLKYKNGDIIPPELLGNRFLRGYFTDKNGETHHYDSSWELDRMKFLDNFLTINWKKNKGDYKVGYLFKGKYKNYFPDFIIHRKGSKSIIIEEIGSWFGNKKIKIKRAEKYFSRKGVKYVVISKKSELQNRRTW